PIPGNILPDGFRAQCGQTQGSYRIAHGREAGLNQFPWMAMLLYRNILRYSNQTLFTVCGGSLINNWYVLTAAHCVRKSKLVSMGMELKRVRLGEHDSDSFRDCSYNRCAAPHLEMDVREVIIHENFNSYTYANDIALVRLELPVRCVKILSFNFNFNISTLYRYTKEIQPICLMRDHIALRNYRLEIAGWGKMENEKYSHVLLRSTIWENTQYCQKKKVFITHSQICAGGQNGWDTCKGDSGGPLMATYKIESSFREFVFLAGITSYGFNSCGRKNIPSAYTKTGVYFQWIRSKLK
ncbi:hypothetical protein KR084_009383, partial [Drosophila pseudotakahashii]